MEKIKRILANINLLNLMLLAGAIALFITLDYPLINDKSKVRLPRIKSVSAPAEEKPMPASGIAYLDYASVAEKNLFHPDRKIPVEKKEDPLLERPDVVLYGTMISRDKKIAHIEDRKRPYSTPGRGKRQTTLTEGEMISGFRLTEVREDSILLTRGGDKILVKLHDDKSRNKKQTAGQPPVPAQTVIAPEPKSVPDSAAKTQMQENPQAVMIPPRVIPPRGIPFQRRASYPPNRSQYVTPSAQ